MTVTLHVVHHPEPPVRGQVRQARDAPHSRQHEAQLLRVTGRCQVTAHRPTLFGSQLRGQVCPGKEAVTFAPVAKETSRARSGIWVETRSRQRTKELPFIRGDNTVRYDVPLGNAKPE